MTNEDRGDETSVFERRPRLTLLLLMVLMLCLLTRLGEMTLRLLGQKPGYRNLKTVDELVVTEPFHTNEEGVFLANPDFDWSSSEHWRDNVPDVNPPGFRGREFNPVATSLPKILFVGDSFTWGSSAEPLSNSFVDLVKSNGYVTFNADIPGTGPTQYAALAEKYVPILEPDIVAIMIYMGNDINLKPDPMLPHKNLYYITNAGWLYAFDKEGKHIPSAKKAYERRTRENRTKALLQKSVLGTRLLLAARSLRDHFITSETDQAAPNQKNQYVIESLQRIQAVSNRYNAEIMVFLIPARPDKVTARSSIADNIQLFAPFPTYAPKELQPSDYVRGINSHFNNSGHRRYADFIVDSINK